MLHILLVEDEPPILRDIQRVVKSFGSDFGVFATASDGQTALNILRKSRNEIDLVITDIHIPMVDGLEMIGEVQRLYPELPCIILSGYSEFNYAKRALQLGVMDYLLKPVDEKALRKLLHDAYEQKALELMQQQNPPLPAGQETTAQYFAVVLCLGAMPYHASLENTIPGDIWQLVPLAGILDALEKEGMPCILAEGYANQIKTLMVRTVKDAHDGGLSVLKKQFAPLQSLAVPATVGIFSDACGMQNIGRRIGDLYGLLRRQLVFGKSSVLCLPGKEAGLEDAVQESIAASVAQLCRDKDNGRAVLAAELQNLLQLLQQNNAPQNILEQYLEALFAGFSAQGISGQPVGQQVNETVVLSDDYATLQDNVLSMLADAAETDGGQTKDDILQRVERYIQENFTGGINTKLIAQKFGFTPAYLSRLFREYRSLSPSDYIASLRIEKARALLAGGSVNVRDVAGAVGYDDALYFSKVFKKATGTSPSQYMENLAKA